MKRKKERKKKGESRERKKGRERIKEIKIGRVIVNCRVKL